MPKEEDIADIGDFPTGCAYGLVGSIVIILTVAIVVTASRYFR